MALAEEEDAGIAGRLKARVRVVVERGARNPQGSGTVVAHEEDRTAALACVVELDDGARDPQMVGVAAVVDGAAAAAATRAGPGRVRAVADGLVVRHHAVQHHPGDADAAQRAPVAAVTASEL